jgi:hypothetical protein
MWRLSLILLFFLVGCSNNDEVTDIISLNQYTEINGDDLNEIYLITNPPKDSIEMLNLLNNYHKKNGRNKQFKTHSRLYIQIRDNNLFDSIVLNKDNKLPDSDVDLRNENFLAKYFWYSSEGRFQCERTFYVNRW